MKCYNCGTELIWGGDHDCENDEDHAIVTNLSCPNCDAFHLVYWGDKDKEDKLINAINKIIALEVCFDKVSAIQKETVFIKRL